jgi:glyoxylase-like metal-dependent hydrolase (beta-lactamase superfamily II)
MRKSSHTMPDTAPFRLGLFECLPVSDGTALFHARSFAINAPKGELEAALAPYPLETGKLRTSFHCLVVRHPAGTVLVDTGMGSQGPKSAGQLLLNLAARGIAPEDIQLVILSHAHPDHMDGALNAAGEPAFPRARYVLSEAEWQFWHSEAAFSHGNRSTVMTTRDHLDRLQPCLDRILPPTALLPGVAAIPAPGHTPGQIALHLASEGEQMIFMADAVAHPLHLKHPTWNIASDVDRGQAIRTRQALLERAAAERITIYVYHFERPGPWRLQRTDGSWEMSAGA